MRMIFGIEQKKMNALEFKNYVRECVRNKMKDWPVQKHKGIWLPHEKLEKEIRYELSSLSHSLHGVSIINLPSGSGKTTMVKKLVKEYIDNDTFRGGIYIDCKDIGDDNLNEHVIKTISGRNDDWVHLGCAIPPLTDEELKTHDITKKDYRIIVVIDHIEHVKKGLNTFCGYALASHNNTPYESFVVLGLTNSDKHAGEIITYNGCTKLQAAVDGKWILKDIKLSRDQVAKLAPGVSDDLLDLGAKAGTFTFVQQLKNEGRADLAEQIEASWIKTSTYAYDATREYNRQWNEYYDRVNRRA